MNNELMHYGVMGMKWGKRKGVGSSSNNKSKDYTTVKALRKKKANQLSNSELREINNRMQLENQYKNLKKQRVSAGKKFVSDVAYNAAKNTASEYATKYAKKGIKFVFDSLI